MTNSTILSKVIFLVPGSTSFPGAQNHYIITLMQWQFWWWFWFTGMLALYDSFHARFFYNRLPHLAPKIVTSYRSHGRWGDLIICLIPVGWCMNILSNSHFLLRALEWQTETAPFFLRVRGKQWYWVYKIDLNNFASIEDIPKIIGRGKKVQFSKDTNDSKVTVHRFVELGYVTKSRQEQVFLKINPNTNKSQSRTVPTIVRGRLGAQLLYKKPFGTLNLNSIVGPNGCINNISVSPAWGKTDIMVDWPLRMGPPWALIHGGSIGMCARYWAYSTVLPDSFSNTISVLFHNRNHNSRKLLWTLTHDIVLKDQIMVCKNKQIMRIRDLLKPVYWAFFMRSIYGPDYSVSGDLKNRIHVWGIPALNRPVNGRSVFSSLHNGEYFENRRKSIYKLIGGDVDFGKEFAKIIKISLMYKQHYCRKAVIFNRCQLKGIWKNRLKFIKNNLLAMRTYLSMFRAADIMVTMEWSDWYRVSNTLRTQNNNGLQKSSSVAIFPFFKAGLGQATFNNTVLRLSFRAFFDVLTRRYAMLEALYPPKKNPYLNVFEDALRFRRRHLVFRTDTCARILYHAFWKGQWGIFKHSNTLAKLIGYTYYSWCKYKLLYSSANHLLERMGDYITDGPRGNILDIYTRTRLTSVNRARVWFALQRNRSLNRWARSNDLGNISFVLLKSPLSAKAPLTFGYYYPDEKPIKTITKNVSITIKQKKIEKTVFDSKLSGRAYTSGSNEATLIYSKVDNQLRLVPNYNYVDQHEFRNGIGSRVEKSNGPTLNKSYLSQKRLLWVNKVLLLPTNVAITIVTNSYDVIHSWFIPGLGLKLDCVPGRSTHHTIYIEYGGYYYGQCAEVCGRRHHHMPIKIRAIPFMIFSYWWRNQIRDDFLKNIS